MTLLIVMTKTCMHQIQSLTSYNNQNSTTRGSNQIPKYSTYQPNLFFPLQSIILAICFYFKILAMFLNYFGKKNKSLYKNCFSLL